MLWRAGVLATTTGQRWLLKKWIADARTVRAIEVSRELIRLALEEFLVGIIQGTATMAAIIWVSSGRN
ncbi:MAG: hypothetical protein ACREV5_19245 [Steroidobacter sp.]